MRIYVTLLYNTLYNPITSKTEKNTCNFDEIAFLKPVLLFDSPAAPTPTALTWSAHAPGSCGPQRLGRLRNWPRWTWWSSYWRGNWPSVVSSLEWTSGRQCWRLGRDAKGPSSAWNRRNGRNICWRGSWGEEYMLYNVLYSMLLNTLFPCSSTFCHSWTGKHLDFLLQVSVFCKILPRRRRSTLRFIKDLIQKVLHHPDFDPAQWITTCMSGWWTR